MNTLHILLVKTLMHMAEEKVFVSETFVARCLDDLAEAGHLEKRPITSRAKEKLGHLTDVNYEIRKIKESNDINNNENDSRT